MPSADPKSKVSIEDLLRLKRAERPGPEFWANFERELHQKQLTALVKKRRWWHDMPVLLGRRLYLPAGAAAVVAFTFVAVRYTATAPMAEIPNTASRIATADPAIETLAPTVVGSLAIESTQPKQQHQDPVAVASTPAPAVEVRDTAELMPAILAAREVETPSARSIAANLQRLEQSEPELVNSVMGSRLSTPARVQTVASVESDMERSAVSDSGKKYRLIARYADRALSPEPSAPANVRDRIARRLGDDLGEGISRIGVVGSRVSLKF
ncbi:MAG TPA: hypothetical protein VIM71_13005 [Lacunisphaera sp.]